MARGRFLSRSLGASERFFELHRRLEPHGLDEFAGELFPMLVTNADDHGRLAGDAFTVKHSCFPISKRGVDDFDCALDAMHDVGLIVRYACNGAGKLVIQVARHDEHQTLKHRQPSAFPAPSTRQLAASQQLGDDLRRVLIACQSLVGVSDQDLVPTDAIIAAVGGAMSAQRLAAILSRINIFPHQQRVSGERVRGYDRVELSRAVSGVSDEEKRREGEEKKDQEQHAVDDSVVSADTRDSRDTDIGDEFSFDDEPVSPKPAKRNRKLDPDSARARATALVELYRESCPKLSPLSAELTKTRVFECTRALKREPDLTKWRLYFERLNRSSFLAGGGKEGWRASFTWALKHESWVKCFEGQYDDRSSTRVIRTADDARRALRDRGVEKVQAENDIEVM